jgi:hypothetical protein
MSQLKLYRPLETGRVNGFDLADEEDHEPAVLPFKIFADRLESRPMRDVVMRARVIHQNKRCPHCHHPVVEPIVLGARLATRDNQPVPGSGTLVGFRCHGCRFEWAV